MRVQLALEDSEYCGEKRGIEIGKEEGILLGREEGIYNAYNMLKKLGYSDEDSLEVIANQYDMDPSKVEEIIEKHK